jgi:Icc-related predicted phosphoesterase
MLVSHVPPFGTALDVHHSAEARADDHLHDGWMAMSGAIRHAAPHVGVFGHSHIRGYDSFDGSETHLLNGGFRGVTTVNLGEGGFGFSFHTAEWLPGEG